ncbi:hypothetical protein C8R46DRAFT_628868 [Mycena filopes]|nr:hypothetical protein C8R46DRAFT_628868 [Mycena filopes]
MFALPALSAEPTDKESRTTMSRTLQSPYYRSQPHHPLPPSPTSPQSKSSPHPAPTQRVHSLSLRPFETRENTGPGRAPPADPQSGGWPVLELVDLWRKSVCGRIWRPSVPPCTSSNTPTTTSNLLPAERASPKSAPMTTTATLSFGICAKNTSAYLAPPFALPASGSPRCRSKTQPVGEAYGSTRSLPCSLPSSPTEAKHLNSYTWTSLSASNTPPPTLPSPEPASNDAPLPPFFPQHSYPHFPAPHFPAPRRPSTSLGFVRRLDGDSSCFDSGSGPERPASASSETGLTNLVRDLNLTPTTANFPVPPAADLYAFPYSTLDQAHNLRTPFHFSALNQSASYPDPANDTGADPVSTDHQNAFPDSQFMMTLDESYNFTNDSNATFSFDNWVFPTMGTSDQ